ncbi:phytanoyl-CoA dioxygenase family protein [Mesorhizobium sp. KR1-2]|uniref:phytanoyl-CoA dioxygenase family protein n=1 Tax=Mesorhizobium sp. KR1-2 TaxID=3156609 RepID=UPI0032B35BA7
MLNQTGEMGASTDGLSELPGGIARQQNALSSDGYIVIREVLTPDQVESLRAAVKKYFRSGGPYKYGDKFQLHAMYEVEDVAKLLTSDTILDRLREITYPLNVVRTGECDLMISTTSSWHNDVPHHPACLDGSIFSDESFRVYKIAFYLQDQDENSQGALKVRPRSHLKGQAPTDDMLEKSIAVRAGDAILFDVRIEHAGQMSTLVERGLRKLCDWIGSRLRPDAQKAFTSTRSILRWIGRTPERVAVFMTFGPSDAWTYSNVEKGRNRHPAARGTLSAEVLTRLAVHNIAPPLIGTSLLPSQIAGGEV